MGKKIKGYPRNITMDGFGTNFNLFTEEVGGKHLGSFSAPASSKTFDRLVKTKKITIAEEDIMKLPRDSEGVSYLRKKVKIIW